MVKLNFIVGLEKKMLGINDDCYPYLGGGYGEGVYDSLSDIDFVIYAKNLPSKEERRAVLKLGNTIASDEITDMLMIEDTKVDFTYISEERLQNLISEKKQDYLTYVINTKHLSKMHPLVEKEKAVFNPAPFIYTLGEMHKKLDVLEQDLQKLQIAFKRGDTFYIPYLFNYFTERMLKIAYSLNDKPYIYPKKSILAMRNFELPDGLLKNLEYISEQENRGISLENKVEKVEKSIALLRRYIDERAK